MRTLPELFANNRRWAAARRAEDAEFFVRQAAAQSPGYLWIGCSDSRVPANEIVDLPPGELFVHRNVANIVTPDGPNALSVLQYGIESLRIPHVIVCGHYGCGGVQAALGARVAEPLDAWLDNVRRVRREHAAELDALPDDDARWRRLCELNVAAQVTTLTRLPVVRAAWQRAQPLVLHGWIYDLAEGLLRDLDVSVTESPPR